MYQGENHPNGLSPTIRRKVHPSDKVPDEECMVNAIVKATCPRCGDVELQPMDLQLRVCSMAVASTYHFTCPRCEEIIVKPAADGRVVTLLQSVGVPTVVWELPAELSETHEGPPLTMDDLIDLHLLLDSANWAERLAAAAS
jgi:predicted RNA-binding Zn-ribbon protein involved in translation (DUF1610 family)